MIDSESTFNKLGLIGRFQIVSFRHVVYSPEFVNLSLVEITCIMNTHQELDEVFEVSSAIYIDMYLTSIYYLINILEIDFLLSYFMLCFQFGFDPTLADEHSSGRHSKKYYLILKKFEFKNRMSLSLRL